jgi:signal peptidase I
VRLILGVVVSLGTLFAVVVLLVVVGAVTGVLHLYRVPSSSMEPTLHCAKPAIGCVGSRDDRVVAIRYLFASPARGDLVAFHTPRLAAIRCGTGGVYIKRIVAVPGDTWQERNGHSYVDGARTAEPFVPAGERDARTTPPVHLGSGRYYVLGDNRESSCDSRVWGPIARSEIIGKIWATYWPPSRATVR